MSDRGQPRRSSRPNPVAWVAATAAMALVALVAAGRLAWIVTKDDNITNAATEIAFVATFFFSWVGWQVAHERAEKPTSPVEDRHEATLRRSCELEIETYGEIVSPSLRDWWLANGQHRRSGTSIEDH